MAMTAWDGAKIGIGVAAIGVVAYVGYKAYKGIGGVVSNLGTGKNITNTGEAIWNARPKVIFKGTDCIIGGLQQ